MRDGASDSFSNAPAKDGSVRCFGIVRRDEYSKRPHNSLNFKRGSHLLTRCPELLWVKNKTPVTSPARVEPKMPFRRARRVKEDWTFNLPRHKAASKKSRSSSREVGAVFPATSCQQSCRPKACLYQTGPSHHRWRTRKKDNAESQCGTGLVRLQTLSASIDPITCREARKLSLACWRPGAIFCPRLHQPAPLLEQVGAPIGRLDLLLTA